MSRALYKQLTDDILAKVGNGDIKVGERLPPEEDYAEQLGVSRSTLRLAFSHLELIGIIERKKRGGTQVISDTPVKKYSVVGDSLKDVLNIQRETFIDVTDVDWASAKDVPCLADYLELGDRWLSVRASRYLSDEEQAFGLTHFYVPEQFADINVQIGDKAESFFNRIEVRYDISVASVKQSISAAQCCAEGSKVLGLEVGKPVIVTLLEMVEEQGQLIEVAYSFLDPARIKINSEFQIGGWCCPR